MALPAGRSIEGKLRPREANRDGADGRAFLAASLSKRCRCSRQTLPLHRVEDHVACTLRDALAQVASMVTDGSFL